MGRRKVPDMREYQRLETGEGDPPPAETVAVHTMSPLHRAAFGASIIFVVAVVASFLWALPCDSATCTARLNAPDVPWDRNLIGLELVGSVHAVGGRVLVVGGEGPMWGQSEFSGHGAIVGLAAALGKVLWYVRLPAAPRFLSCPPEQPPVCFSLFSPTTLSAINPVTGIFLWQKVYSKWTILDYPILIPDFDKDDSADIALIAKSDDSYDIVVISGRRGNVSSVTKINTTCISPSNLTFDEIKNTYKYSCSEDLTQETSPGSGVVGGSGFPSQSGQDGATITYANSGTCPECSVSLEVKTSSGTVLWSVNYEHEYVMRPLPLHLKTSISGFLLKLWQWQPQPKQVVDGANVEVIQERIVLITLMGGKIVIANASQTEITRLCNASLHCQPRIHSDTALIADVNGDGLQDLVSYYVTYKWVPEENEGVVVEGQRWQLESRIRVIRFEAELPKLYRP